jgi:hypothetical protein
MQEKRQSVKSEVLRKPRGRIREVMFRGFWSAILHESLNRVLAGLFLFRCKGVIRERTNPGIKSGRPDAAEHIIGAAFSSEQNGRHHGPSALHRAGRGGQQEVLGRIGGYARDEGFAGGFDASRFDDFAGSREHFRGHGRIGSESRGVSSAERRAIHGQNEGCGYNVASSTIAPKTVGNVFSPEGERIELLEDLSENVQFTFDDESRNGNAAQQKMVFPSILHHVHFFVPDGSVPEIKAWYGKIFGALPGRRYHYEADDLPGVNLNFSGVPTKMEPTKGRMLDHIGFEVMNLEAFCKRLESNGFKLDSPYKKDQSGIAKASHRPVGNLY